MLSHERIWAAIDALAHKNQLSISGLARKAGLDPTSFNKSKRSTGEGRPRWPSTESIAKALRATGADLDDFMELVKNKANSKTISANYAKGKSGKRHVGVSGLRTNLRDINSPHSVPLLGFAEAGAGGFFDDGGFPVGQGWEQVDFPAADGELIYALEVSGDSMMPLYRDGDRIIVNTGANVRKGDRVVVKTNEGEVMAKILLRKTTKEIQLQSFNPAHKDRIIAAGDIAWMARIIWASQ